MLSPEENEKLTRVVGDTPMGNLLRRYWQPFALSEDLPQPGSDPLRVRMLGEDLMAFRDTNGKVGLTSRRCPHRAGGSLLRPQRRGRHPVHLPRLEVRRGWTCLETPTEPAAANFAVKMHLRAYPVEEKAGILWAYMGPAVLKPAIGRLRVDARAGEAIGTSRGARRTATLPRRSRAASTRSTRSTCTAPSTRTAGRIPTSSPTIGAYRIASATKDNPPVLFAENTDYGVLVGGRVRR